MVRRGEFIMAEKFASEKRVILTSDINLFNYDVYKVVKETDNTLAIRKDIKKEEKNNE